VGRRQGDVVEANAGVAVTVAWNESQRGSKSPQSLRSSPRTVADGPTTSPPRCEVSRSPVGLSRRMTEVPRLTESMMKSSKGAKAERDVSFDAKSSLSAKISDAKARRNSISFVSSPLQDRRADAASPRINGTRNVRHVPTAGDTSKDHFQPGHRSLREISGGEISGGETEYDRHLERGLRRSGSIFARQEASEALLTTSMPCLPGDCSVENSATSPRPHRGSVRNLMVEIVVPSDDEDENYTASPVRKQELRKAALGAPSPRFAASPSRKSALTRSSLENSSMPSFSLPQVQL
jgi:hypothetical protein